MVFLNSDEANNFVDTLEATSVMVCWQREGPLPDIAEVFTMRILIIYMNVFVGEWCIALLY